jgi:hypothetical protein
MSDVEAIRIENNRRRFVPVVESIRPMNISLPKVYPFASDKNLVLTLEAQMEIQEKNIKETEKTGNNVSKQENLSATRPMVIILTVALSIFLILLSAPEVKALGCFLNNS